MPESWKCVECCFCTFPLESFQFISISFELTDSLNVECWLIDWLIDWLNIAFIPFQFFSNSLSWLIDWMLIDWLIDWLNAECWMLLLYFSSSLQAVLSWLIDWMPKGKLETCARYQFSPRGEKMSRGCRIFSQGEKMSQGCKILEIVTTSFCQFLWNLHSISWWICFINSKLVTISTE